MNITGDTYSMHKKRKQTNLEFRRRVTLIPCRKRNHNRYELWRKMMRN
jgi:hypothetical protein